MQSRGNRSKPSSGSDTKMTTRSLRLPFGSSSTDTDPMEETERTDTPSPSNRNSIDESGPPTPTTGPPVNFGHVAAGIYRSSFPRYGSFEYLETLRLKTVLTLVSGSYPSENREFISVNGIKHVQVPILAHKSESDCIPIEAMTKALEVVMNIESYPLLVHCNKGKHRTGCVLAVFRKLSGWPIEQVLREYRQYAGAKARVLDEIYIRSFNKNDVLLKLNNMPAAGMDSMTRSVFPTPPSSLKDEKAYDGDDESTDQVALWRASSMQIGTLPFTNERRPTAIHIGACIAPTGSSPRNQILDPTLDPVDAAEVYVASEQLPEQLPKQSA